MNQKCCLTKPVSKHNKCMQARKLISPVAKNSIQIKIDIFPGALRTSLFLLCGQNTYQQYSHQMMVYMTNLPLI